MEKWYTFLPILLALVSFNAKASNWLDREYTATGFSIAGGWDVIHTDDPDEEAQALDKEYYEIRYRQLFFDLGTEDFFDTFGWHTYLGNKDTIGIGIYATSGPFMFGWGIEVAEPNELTSTEGGYELLLEVLITERLAVGIKHRSNCKSVCDGRIPGLNLLPRGDSDTHNRGWNYLTLRYNFG